MKRSMNGSVITLLITKIEVDTKYDDVATNVAKTKADSLSNFFFKNHVNNRNCNKLMIKINVANPKGFACEIK